MFRIVLCRDIIGRMTTDSIRGSRSLRWNINVPAREHQRSNGGTKSVEYAHKKRHRYKYTILRNMMIADRLVDETLTYKIKGD